MRARIPRYLATALLLFVVSPLQAEEYDITIGGMAHVFVADPVQDEPEIKAPKESERPKQGERIEKD